MKKWCAIVLCLLLLTSCAGKNIISASAEYAIDRFVVYVAGGDGMTQTVYDLGANGEGVNYIIFPDRGDWADIGPFDYFTDDISSLGSRLYTMEQIALDAAIWQQMVDCLEKNDFFVLPEEIQSPGADVPHYYILVEANGTTHTVGGWGAPHEDSENGARFSDILKTFFLLID